MTEILEEEEQSVQSTGSELVWIIKSEVEGEARHISRFTYHSLNLLILSLQLSLYTTALIVSVGAEMSFSKIKYKCRFFFFFF